MEILSYLLGLVLIAAGLMFHGFFKEVGKDIWGYLKSKFNPPDPDPIKVDGSFDSKQPTPSNRAWVNESKLYDFESRGYTYYPHPKNQAKCFRETGAGNNRYIEFLMVKPDADKVKT